MSDLNIRLKRNEECAKKTKLPLVDLNGRLKMHKEFIKKMEIITQNKQPTDALDTTKKIEMFCKIYDSDKNTIKLQSDDANIYYYNKLYKKIICIETSTLNGSKIYNYDDILVQHIKELNNL